MGLPPMVGPTARRHNGRLIMRHIFQLLKDRLTHMDQKKTFAVARPEKLQVSVPEAVVLNRAPKNSSGNRFRQRLPQPASSVMNY